MSLKNILIDISSVLGLDITNEDEKAYYIEKINEAAREIYTSMDLPGSIREQIFQITDVETYQCSFPFYVDKLRAIRFYNVHGGKLILEDLRPRYHQRRWGVSGLLRYRIKTTNNPLARDITNAGPIRFAYPQNEVAEKDIVITIVGKTHQSERFSEVVTIVKGTNNIVGIQGWEVIDNIEKDDYTDFDIGIFDIDDQDMGKIANSELRPSYTIVVIRQDDFAPVYNNTYPLNTIEALYKIRFTPFRNLMDEFPAPNCDKVIFWKFAELFAANKPGFEQRAVLAAVKVKELLGDLTTNDELGKEIQVEFGSHGVYDAQIYKNPMPAPFGANYPLIEYISS